MSAIMWHDVECGGYAEDLPLWRELAAAEAGPVPGAWRSSWPAPATT